MNVPSAILFRYFDVASSRLQSLANDPNITSSTLDWHRNIIVREQLASLDESLTEWARDHVSSVSKGDVQSVLREIGLGDFTNVIFDEEDGANNCIDAQLRLAEAMSQTNECARLAFARSAIFTEWRVDTYQPQIEHRRTLRGYHTAEEGLERYSILEYCGMMMSAIRLDEIQQYLENGVALIPSENPNQTTTELTSVDDRLNYIQQLCWRTVGWESAYASEQLQSLFSPGNDISDNYQALLRDENVVEALTKYASAMTVAAANASVLPNADDGTTRVVQVSYSEKFISLPESTMNDNDDNIVGSLSAPTSNSIQEHGTSQQRQQLDIAHKTATLQQQLWNDFQSLSHSEQIKTLDRARRVQEAFLVNIKNTPPGSERVMLMQSMDGETQRLLVVYKLWSSHNDTE
jgi:hypothetical protein